MGRRRPDAAIDAPPEGAQSGQPFRVAIVGAGWSGLACAEALSASAGAGAGAGAEGTGRSLAITLIEAAPQAGGRARGLSWRPDGWADADDTGALPIDNGQHLLIGAYTATRDLLRRAGVTDDAWHQHPLHWAVPGAGPNPASLLIVPSDAGIKRILKSALPRPRPAGYAGWPLAWRLSLAKTLIRGWQSGWLAQGTAEAWWAQQSVPTELMRYFWKPVVEGALNTPIAQASARVALQVIKDSLLGPSHASDTLHPLQSLTAQAVGPITQTLQHRGLHMVFGCRLTAITAITRSDAQPARPAARWRLGFHGTSQAKAAESGLTEAQFDAVVLALPAQICRSLEYNFSGCRDALTTGSDAAALNGFGAFDQERNRWNSVRGLGVTTLYAALRPDQAARAGLSPKILQPAGVSDVAMILARPTGPQGQVIAAVASATERQTEAKTHQLLRGALSQVLSPRLGEDAFAKLPLRTTHDYQATWACTADHVDRGAAWGPSALGPSGLYRAGDDLTPGYPACIESAVRGGVQTAQAVLAQARAAQ